MCAILVDMDALHILGVHISRDVRPLVDHEHRLSRLFCVLREHRAEQSRTYY